MDTTDLDPAVKNLPGVLVGGNDGIPNQSEVSLTGDKPGPRSFLGLRRKRNKKAKINSASTLSEAQETVVEETAFDHLDDNSLATHSDPEGSGVKSKPKKKGFTHVLSKYKPKIRRSPSAPTDMRPSSRNNSDGTSVTSEDSLSLTLPPPTGGQFETSLGSTMSGYSTPMPLVSSGYATPMFFESAEEPSTPEISHTDSLGETEEDDHPDADYSLSTTPNTVYADGSTTGKEAEQMPLSSSSGTAKSSDSIEDLPHELKNKASKEPTEQREADESQSSLKENSMAQANVSHVALDIPSQDKEREPINFSELEDLIQSPESGLGSDASPLPVEETQTKELALNPEKSRDDLTSTEAVVLTSEAEAIVYPIASSPFRVAATLAKLDMGPTTEPPMPVPTASQDLPVPGERREYLYKVLVIGELGTGKTSIIKRYVHQFFSQHYRATIGVDFALKVIHWDPNTLIRLQLWDIAGQERFGNMTRVYYKEAVGAFIVFDVTRNATFEAITKWKQDLDSKVQLQDGSPIPCVLLANKCDQPKEGIVQNSNKMDEFCKEHGFAGWFETSAKDNINIEDAAKFLISKILANDRWNAEESADADKLALDGKAGEDPLKKSCC